jgi:hypothetical protein
MPPLVVGNDIVDGFSKPILGGFEFHWVRVGGVTQEIFAHKPGVLQLALGAFLTPVTTGPKDVLADAGIGAVFEALLRSKDQVVPVPSGAP